MAEEYLEYIYDVENIKYIGTGLLEIIIASAKMGSEDSVSRNKSRNYLAQNLYNRGFAKRGYGGKSNFNQFIDKCSMEYEKRKREG